jgi:hypothetical protein
MEKRTRSGNSTSKDIYHSHLIIAIRTRIDRLVPSLGAEVAGLAYVSLEILKGGLRMEEVAKLLQSVVESYGFWGAIAVIVIMVATQLIKWPLKKKAEAWAGEAKVDKKAITAWFVFIPIVCSLIVTFIFYAWRSLSWDFSKFSWSSYFSISSVLASVSVALYEAIDAFVKAKLAKEKKAIAEATGSKEVETLSASQISKAYSDVKAATKLAKKQAKEVAEKKEKAKKIEELESELAKLKSDESSTVVVASATKAEAVQSSVVKIN